MAVKLISALKNNTPIQQIKPGLFVKREDLCIDGPAFSKMRGVYTHLLSRPENTVGVLDTFHSKAGWGVSMLCKQMGKQAVVFYPVYKGDHGIRGNQINAKNHDAKLIGLTAGRSCILYHRAKKQLQENYPYAYMMPNALKLDESITETAREVQTVPECFMRNTIWVVSISSGTIAAGVLLGLLQRDTHGVPVYIHMGYSRSKDAVVRYFHHMTGKVDFPFSVLYIDEGYQYKDAVNYPCPFPCNPYYDRKAWQWINEVLIPRKQNKQILFWNIGA